MENITKIVKERYWLIILLAIFIFSFVLDLYVLTRYSLSYGIDGAFYDIQVQHILQIGYPLSNDPPVAYYLLTPFVLLIGNSFLGIKIGMALIGSLLAFPAFLLTECYTRKKGMGSKVPALLSAFLVTVNINYFAMIGDFMQNLVGVFFLAIFLYFAVRWFENISRWRKYGVLTFLFLCLNLLTHIYTGALAVLLFFSLLFFNIALKTYKTRKLPWFDLKILGILGILILICIVALFLVYPVMYSKLTTVISFFNASSSTTNTATGRMGDSLTGMIFCSLPYLLGILAVLAILYRGLKEKIGKINWMNKNTMLVWLYLTLAAALAILSFVPSDYQSRFVLMAFLPIALIVPLGIKFFENEFLARYPKKKKIITLLVVMIAVVFASSSFYSASETFASMGPTITADQYNELVKIKGIYLSNETGQNSVVVAQDFQTKYWVEYVLGGNVATSVTLQELTEEYGNNTTIYQVTSESNHTASGSAMNNNYNGSFLLPYGPPILPNSIDKIPTGSADNTKSQIPSGNSRNNPMNSTDRPSGNLTMNPKTNSTPPALASAAPGSNSTTGNAAPGLNNMNSIAQSLTGSGTTIFNGKYFKIVRYTN
jgi:4-amino-4-deoxy-L-arabinose transferase-like glycosyltransferase